MSVTIPQEAEELGGDSSYDELSAALGEDDQETELDPESRRFFDELIDKIWLFVVEFAGIEGFPYFYQELFGKAIIRSVVTEDGEMMTGLISRQAGKSETLANCIAALMILLPRLAKMFPSRLGKFKRGFWVGCFAPTEEQVSTLFTRVVDRLTSEHAMDILTDDEIDDEPKANTRYLSLKKCGSFVRMQTANPRAKIEGKTYHWVILDEAQDVDEYVVEKSIIPMTVAVAGSIVMIGTPTITKSVFYKTIQYNKRRELERGGKRYHFEFDWRACAKANPRYRASVRRTALRIGEDSDEFRMNYRLEWLLDRGMFTTEERMEELGDPTMQVVHAWWKTPLIAGLDPARKLDSTVLTVMYVDWDHPDEFGLYHHRVLNWLEIHGEQWEEQYARVTAFLEDYPSLFALAVDANGMGGPVAERLQVLLPNVEVVELSSSPQEQAKRWKHLMTLFQRGLITWPAHPKVRRTKVYRRFVSQMTSLEKRYDRGLLTAEAPDERGAHDDFCSSLSLAAVLTDDLLISEAEQSQAPWSSEYRHR